MKSKVHRSVNKIPSNLVYPTKSDTSSVSDYIFSERWEEIAEDVPTPAEDVPAPAPPAPAPAPTLETVEEQPHTPGTRKSTHQNFGKLASAYSDSYIQTLSQPGLVDTQYNLGLCKKL